MGAGLGLGVGAPSHWAVCGEGQLDVSPTELDRASTSDMNAAATKPGRTRRLKNASFELEFFFMGSVWSYSFLFPAEVVLCNCGSGRDEEPSGEEESPPGFRSA
jgi:hypothetical protein